ncbi:puromycin-sensitive aminopeptidase [Stylonychia lemnae]|uniref:Puromycin-sensitive aminopeptidase n=1 Tax=Stylonychia lemnae TaxID=5949 RepID=A0A078B8E2_STYLE|nr:puromycin-sensitive aminopeptidase [Stylonychia lemnae]|eukprot:CDW90785.1 puromycin-sensitive aminopeptidase [Stylonychia lemnae]
MVEGRNQKQEKKLRLPDNVLPIKYILTFEPNSTYSEFNAELDLVVQIKSDSDVMEINLHKDHYSGVINPELCEGVFSVVDQKLIPKDTTQTEEVNQAFRLENTQICTQFQDKFARMLMPCLDEPQFKAIFQVNVLVKEKTHQAISNSACCIEQLIDGNRLYKFEDTLKMPTYLLAIVIGKFDTLTLTTKRGVQIKTYTQSGLSEDARESTQLACEAFDYLEEYFQIDYPLQKADIISCNKFSVVGMENWGCIIFDRYLILGNQNNTNKDQLFNNYRTLCHEVCHQWFGNLVTMQWWDDIWLNEGFSRYMEHVMMADLRPEFNVWQEFMDQMYFASIQLDSFLEITHPVQLEVKGNEKFYEIFDTISYNKGSSICRMIEGYIGDKNLFRECMRVYMKQYQYRNASTAELFQVMSEVSGKPVAKVFHKWIQQPCFPEILVTKVSEKQYKLRQQCFNSQTEDLWIIPVNYVTSKQKIGQFLIENQDLIVDIPELEADEMIWFNYNAFGYYILRYEDQNEFNTIYDQRQIFGGLTVYSIKVNREMLLQ